MPVMGDPAQTSFDAPSLDQLRAEAAGCRACDLWRSGTQTVFGEGREDAEVMMVGEQPGDREDVEGHPFVGPAGRLLDRALAEAGIDRRLVYVTNVVKHFKWRPRGKRRIHQKPNAEEIRACRPWLEGELAVVRPRGKRRIHQKPNLEEIRACRPWLDTELEIIKPRVLVCLGSVAAQALLGRQFRVTRERGRFVESPLAERVTATVHPSSILRAGDDEARQLAMAEFVDDLRVVARELDGS